MTIVDLELADYERAAGLVVAESRGISEIATLDRRHFRAVRPRHTDAFLLP